MCIRDRQRGAALDGDGHHARTCGLGPGRNRRRNAVIDWLAQRLGEHGCAALTEQRAMQWDTEAEQARLDIAVLSGAVRHW
eukprot:8397828-Alexandrium_andersonii.AAC.1